MSRATVWTLAVLLGASVLLNVGLLLREPPIPATPPPVVERVEIEVPVYHDPVIVERRVEVPSAPTQPFVTDPGVADGLDVLDAEDRLTAELDRLRQMEDRMAPGQIHRAILENVAAHLGFAEPARSRFIGEGEAIATELAVLDAEYDAAIKQAYFDAGRDWTQAKVSPELAARWREAKDHAAARLTAHLNAGDATHAAFLEDHMHALVWGYLSRSGFSWE